MCTRPRRAGRSIAALRPVATDLAESIDVELLQNRSNEFTEVVAWVNSEIRAAVRRCRMRAILLSGHDAVDVTRVIDDGHILLVDLASTQIERWVPSSWARWRRSTGWRCQRCRPRVRTC